MSLILHEMGHALGLEDDYSDASREDLMHGCLAVGERRLPGALPPVARASIGARP